MITFLVTFHFISHRQSCQVGICNQCEDDNPMINAIIVDLIGTLFLILVWKFKTCYGGCP